MDYSQLETLNLKANDKYRININFAWFFVIFSFVLTETVRGIFSERLGWMNLPFLLCFLFYYAIAVKKGRIKLPILTMVLTFSALVLLNTFFLHKGITYTQMTIANLLAPLFMLSIIISQEQALSILKTVLKILNGLIVILTILGVIDYLTQSSLQLLLASTIFSGTQIGDLITTENSWGIYRYYSIIGHPLINAKYYLTFFILNIIYATYAKPIMPRFLVSTITMIGLVLSGSKTALILGLVLIIFFNGLKRRKAFYLFLTVIALTIFFNTSLFQDNLKMRFVQGMEYGDITSGRNILFNQLLESDIEKPSLIVGGGADYSRKIAYSLNGNIFNFEYPFIMLAYDYGIFGMFIIYFCLFLYPIFLFVKRKKYYILFLFLILSLMVNSNNGIANLGSDSLIQLCFINLILINLTKSKENTGNLSISYGGKI
jgi:hypothetical protein